MASAYDRTPPPDRSPGSCRADAVPPVPARTDGPVASYRSIRTGFRHSVIRRIPGAGCVRRQVSPNSPVRTASGGRCRRIPDPESSRSSPCIRPEKNRTAPFDDPVAASLPMPPEHLSRRCSLMIRGIPFSTVAATACTHPAHPRHAAAAQRHTTFDKPPEPGRLSGPAPSGRFRLPCSRRPLRRHKPAGVKRRPVRSPALAGTRAGQGASYRHRAGTPPTESDR